MSETTDSITGEPPTIRLTTDTLAGSLRDFVLNQLKFNHNPLPWNERSEEEQKRIVADISATVRVGVLEAVRAIAADGRPVIVGTLKSFTTQGGIKAVVELPKDEDFAVPLFRSTGKEVLLVVSDAKPFLNMGADVPIKPDQSDIEQYAEEAAALADAVAGAETDAGHPLHDDAALDAATQGDTAEAAAASSDEVAKEADDGGGWEDTGKDADDDDAADDEKGITKADKDQPRRVSPQRKKRAARGGVRGKRMALRAARGQAGTH